MSCSEWTKLRSLRSTIFSMLAAVVFIVGLSVLVPSVTVAHWPPHDPGEAAAFDPTSRSLGGIFLAQLAIGVLGVLLITGEYATGMIRATLAAVPARLPVLWAKADRVRRRRPWCVTVPSVLGAFLVGPVDPEGQAPAGRRSATRGAASRARCRAVPDRRRPARARPGRPAAQHGGRHLRPVRVLFVLPIIVRFLPSSWADPITTSTCPTRSGEAITHVHPDPSALAPWAGFGLFCGYAAVVLIAAGINLRRRDA